MPLVERGQQNFDGNPIWQQLLDCGPQKNPMTAAQLSPLWNLGITSFKPLIDMVGGQAYMTPVASEEIKTAFRGRTSDKNIKAARAALNRLSLFLNGYGRQQRVPTIRVPR